MIKTRYYSELSFSIDLIRDAYQTNDVALIRRKLRSDLSMLVTEVKISACINSTEEYEKSQKVTMKKLFKPENKYEPARSGDL